MTPSSHQSRARLAWERDEGMAATVAADLGRATHPGPTGALERQAEATEMIG